MWQRQDKDIFKLCTRKAIAALMGLCIIGLLLAGCGGANSSTASNVAAAPNNPNVHSAQGQQTDSNSSASNTASGQKTGTVAQYGPQYLVKSLQVSMEVQNPVKSASDLQQWIAFTDPQSTSDGTDYENAGGNQYNVNLTFLVDIAHYTQVETYLRTYAGQKGNTLLSLKETVQDVTNDYVDSQSTLTNLRAEQQRLLNFMNQAQNVNDAVNIEQQLTQVEGQINTIEAHINALKGQTTFYTISISLEPVGSAPPPTPPSTWSAIPIWQGAWSAVVAVWQLLVAVLLWLLAFSVYIVPLGILIWLIRKRPWRGRGLPLPRVKPVVAPQPLDKSELE